MLKATLRSLAAHKIRMLLTGFAVVLGVAFVAGTLIFTDTLSRTFDRFFAENTSDVSVTRQSEFEDDDAATTTVPASLVDTVRAVPGVAEVEGSILVDGVQIVDKDGEGVLGAEGAPAFGANWSNSDSDENLTVHIVDGRPPAAPDEVVIDAVTAANGDRAVGDPISVVTPGPRVDATLVGIFDYNGSSAIGGVTVTAFDDDTAQRLLTAPGAYTSVEVAADEGVSDDELAQRVAQAVGGDYEVKTGAQVADEDSADIREGLSFISTFLLVFAAVALFVGVFLILNTFSMLVAQRTRELALLRAVGASRKQVMRSVLGEAFTVGVIGSTLGLGAGFGLAIALKALFAQLGLELTSASLVLEPRTVLVSYVVGIVVTLVAAYFPARRASRIPPVAALRDDVALPEASLRRRLISGSALGLLGAVAMTASLAGGAGIALLGIGVLGVFVGVILLTPLFARPVVRALGAPFARLYGTVGRLSRENALRNPRRTSVTASALMIGLALVASLSTLGASAKKSADAIVETQKADYTIDGSSFTGFSPQVGDAVAAVPGVDLVAREQFRQAKIGNDEVEVTGFDGPLDAIFDLTFIEGPGAEPQGTGMLVSESAAQDRDLAVGDTVTIQMPAGSANARVAGIFEDTQLVTGFILSSSLVERLSGDDRDSWVYVLTAPGADVRAALDAAVQPYPNVDLRDQQEFKDMIRGELDQLLYVMYALLALAIVIAAIGIVNTLALSVYERTREVGLLRAVGLSRRQLRRMIRIESVVISIFGAVLGVVLGVAFGVAVLLALADEGISELTVPLGQLGLFVVVAGVIGVIAAVWPARRAAKLDVLAAVTTEAA